MHPWASLMNAELFTLERSRHPGETAQPSLIRQE